MRGGLTLRLSGLRKAVELPGERINNVSVNAGTYQGDSLTLSLLSGAVCTAAYLLGYSGFSPWWGDLIMWLACPGLVLFTSGSIVSDLLRQETRRQAFIAAVLLVPTAAVVWHFRFRGLSGLPR